MKKLVTLMVAMMVFAGIQAQAKGPSYPMTKEQYIAARQKRAEKKGQEFKPAKEGKRFDKMDANGDGLLSEDEAAAAKAASAAKKAAKEAAPSEE